MKPTGCAETAVTNCGYWMRNGPEQQTVFDIYLDVFNM
jgi:hypothetical protein